VNLSNANTQYICAAWPHRVPLRCAFDFGPDKGFNPKLSLSSNQRQPKEIRPVYREIRTHCSAARSWAERQSSITVYPCRCSSSWCNDVNSAAALSLRYLWDDQPPRVLSVPPGASNCGRNSKLRLEIIYSGTHCSGGSAAAAPPILLCTSSILCDQICRTTNTFPHKRHIHKPPPSRVSAARRLNAQTADARCALVRSPLLSAGTAPGAFAGWLRRRLFFSCAPAESPPRE
jgi:hypothetical protein